ncbi:MAG: ArsR/SmtB family transcription factor [Oryzihumus sp.]
MATDFTTVGRLLSVPARSAMVSALLEGRALTVGELARVAGVSASTASEHVTSLDAGGLVRVLRQGRHRYVALSGPQVAAALEALALVSPPVPVTSLRQSRDARALRAARTCYDHLAGELGVRVHDALVRQGWVATDPAYLLTDTGAGELRALGVDVDRAVAGRRPVVRPCLAWTERRYHLAGALAGEVARTFLERDWVRRTQGRGLRLTPAGEELLRQCLDPSEPAPARATAR